MAKLYVLFEHAAGYGIFKVKEFEEVGMFLPQLESSVTDLSRFNAIVQLISFSPFKTAVAALENINAVSEGILSEDLQKFLDLTIPKSKKITLGVSDPKLSAAIAEALNIQCTHIGVVPEIIRGIRVHFHNLVKGFTAKSSGVAQLGLGHSYSRAKIKFNVHRSDNMIIQCIALLDQMDKDINTFSMRIREWYSYHFPELIKIVPENYLYAKLIKYIKNRKDLSDQSIEGLEEIIMDSGKAEAIVAASKASMGMDISPIDLINIQIFAERVISLSDFRKRLAEYLSKRMSDVAPNLAQLTGDQVGARLIAHAGSLTNLAKYPASTVQILGAEKALFRALKTRGNTPKYGLLYHSSFIGRAGTRNKGRISRCLANKCSIASRIDCFSEIPNDIFGMKLKQQVEDRLKFYETGEVPKKNVEVMKEALEEVQQFTMKLAENDKKKKKKKKKSNDQSIAETSLNGSFTETPIKNNKEKKSNDQSVDETFSLNGSHTETPVKKEKKKKSNEQLLVETSLNSTSESAVKKEKKKKKKQQQHVEEIVAIEQPPAVDDNEIKKHKKRKHEEIVNNDTFDLNDSVMEQPKKKKKKNKA